MLSQSDRLLLRELQLNFPFTPRPYRAVAQKFGLTEKQVIKKVKLFQDKGIIRYVGGIFDQRKLGIASSLIALSVPKKDLPRVVNIINSYPQVTHNYLRRDKYNLWFTVSASSRNKLLRLVKEIKKKVGKEDMLDLATLKVFKIDARFRV